MNDHGRAPVRVLIVDDEPLARSTLRVLCAADPEVEVVGEHGNAEAALAAIATQAPDLVFLDVQMPGMDGFQLLAAVPAARAFAVVFVTAYDTHALRAFDVGAIDYLLKPFDDERFAAALARAKEHLRRGRVEDLARKLASALALVQPGAPPGAATTAGGTAGSPDAPQRIAVRDGGRIAFVDVDEIDWIEADDYYVQIHAAGSKQLVRESLRKLEARLDPHRFVRIHRSAIVNVTRIRELRPDAHGEATAVLADGTELTVSRRNRARLHALLGLS